MEHIRLKICGFPREYALSAHRQSGASVVLFLPGTGATAEWADEETGWSLLARREGFTIAIPEGLRPDSSSPARFLTNPSRWDDGSPPLFESQPKSDDVAFLTSVLEDVWARTGNEQRHVFVSGFSNGAGMAFRFAAERADLVVALAPVAGYCWLAQPKPVRPVPTLYMVGSVDPFVPLLGGEVRNPWQHRYVRRPSVAATLESWAHAIGCDPNPQTQRDDGGLRVDSYPGSTEFTAVTIEGLGHHWPGGKGRLNQRMAGAPSSSVSATEMVWEFFKRHMK